MALTKKMIEDIIYGKSKINEPEKVEIKGPADEEWIWVKGYKGTDANMCCRGYEYELNQVHSMTEDVELCNSGFHFCLRQNDVYRYYEIGDGNRFFEVEALVKKRDYDELEEKMHSPSMVMHFAFGGLDSKMTSKAIRFVRELTIDEILAFDMICHEQFDDELKEIAIKDSIAAAKKIFKERNDVELVYDLVKLGYSKTFAQWVVSEDRYKIAEAVGTQTGLSMDMRVWAIMHNNDD
jgi:hypothetical protein